MVEDKFFSSEQAFKSFLESSVWRDMEREVNIRLEQIRDALEDPEGEETEESTERLRGAAKVFRQVLRLPEDILENIKHDKELEEDDRRRDET